MLSSPSSVQGVSAGALSETGCEACFSQGNVARNDVPHGVSIVRRKVWNQHNETPRAAVKLLPELF